MEEKKYTFDEEFQKALVSLALRDVTFMRKARHLLFPQHFEKTTHATLCKVAIDFYDKYKAPLDVSVLRATLLDAVKTRKITKEELTDATPLIKEIYHKDSLPPAQPIIDRLADFAKQSAVTSALYDSVALLDKGEYEKINEKLKNALNVGADNEANPYDYFSEIKQRTEIRMDESAGLTPPKGITSGFVAFDKFLYHKGWGRRELSLLMGGAKQGKSLALLNFAANASRAGFNCLYVTLEVSAEIISSRLDACISQTSMDELTRSCISVRDRVETVASKSGKLHIKEFPSGALKVSDLTRFINLMRDQGIKYDLLCVDYADLMAPEHRSPNPIENFRTIYVDLRALAFEFDCAVLTATQTNRQGFKAQTATLEHVAEDFNKVRTADLVISINATEDERKEGKARLYFAACRNAKSGFTLNITQDIEKMKFITSIESVT